MCVRAWGCSRAMEELSPLSPEARRRARRRGDSERNRFARLRVDQQGLEVAKRVAVGVYSDGFMLAGNFAYMAMLALFAFCIVAASITGAFGRTGQGLALLQSFFATVPPSVAEALRGPVESAMTARSGPVLWFSALVGLWTVGSLIETIRSMLHRAYGTSGHLPFWQYRIRGILVIVGAVLLAMVAFSANVLVTGVEKFVASFLPGADTAGLFLAFGRLLPFLVLFASLYTLFRIITPRDYRGPDCPKWPGAMLVAAWWVLSTQLLPVFLSRMANYDLTYGSLAGAMVALIFFWLVGFGMVIGAHLNAALANEDGMRQRAAGPELQEEAAA